MQILVLNSGSSSIKYVLFQTIDWSVMAAGLVENIGGPSARLLYNKKGEEHRTEMPLPGGDHRCGFAAIQEVLQNNGGLELDAIGHRVVHGGESFHKPVLIDDTVIAAIEKLVPLAPLHNPANLMGIRSAMEHVPKIPQVAVLTLPFTNPFLNMDISMPFHTNCTRSIRCGVMVFTAHPIAMSQDRPRNISVNLLPS